MKKSTYKQLTLFDTWEEDNKNIIEYYKPEWKESLWNKDVWYLQTQIGYSTTDSYERSKYNGTMLPTKTKYYDTKQWREYLAK